MHAPRQQLIAPKNRRHLIADIVVRMRPQIVGNLIFIANHLRIIERARSSNQIFPVVVLTRQLIADQMRAVIQIAALDLFVVPASGRDV